jgi:hypothetical protein
MIALFSRLAKLWLRLGHSLSCGSFVESYPLFGLRLEDHDELLAEVRPALGSGRPSHRPSL